MSAALLATEALTLAYGRFVAVRDVSLQLQPGRRYGVLGPNGAGKTSLLNLLTGTLRATSGSIRFEAPTSPRSAPTGAAISASAAASRRPVCSRSSTCSTTCAGRALAPAAPDLRLLVAAQPGPRHRRAGRGACGARRPDGQVARARVGAVVRRGLRQLEIALALATEPRLLLLDEPTAGMSEEETHAVVDMLRASLPRALTLMIIEHDLKVIEGLTDHVFVFDQGALFEQGSPAEIRASERVQRIYFKGRKLA